MLYGKYQFLCRLENEALLPFYKGSTFRGVFGRALKKVVCALKRQECSQCLLKQRCVYALVFETSDALQLPAGSKVASPPHPYVIEPPLTTETHFEQGSSFDFNLLLFGKTNDNLPYFIYAFDQMGKIGIGKKNNGKRGKFILKKVISDNHIIYSNTDQKINKIDFPASLSLTKTSDYPKGSFCLRLILETPLRIKFENKLKADLPFHVLVRAVLRRISSLFNTYGSGEPSLDYRELVKQAETVNIVNDSLEWFDWRRYSFRQDKAMLMGGIVGSIVYEGEIGAFMPFIQFCEKVHLGKQTSFGLGKIKAEIIS
ncbi:MAG: CRISPR system precrRNA processing endoribonuclease RAMP protein Cas6 [Desulfobacterales bacterium]|nr:CRISPR system precrRNA processing endoribonuclease RAMP protein Cas6 [Desulfobacterales bacterium]